jgi:hypothetical protein
MLSEQFQPFGRAKALGNALSYHKKSVGLKEDGNTVVASYPTPATSKTIIIPQQGTAIARY